MVLLLKILVYSCLTLELALIFFLLISVFSEIVMHLVLIHLRIHGIYVSRIYVSIEFSLLFLCLLVVPESKFSTYFFLGTEAFK